MKIIYIGSIYEIIDLETGYLRLYCENISQAREDNILNNLDIEYTVQSRCNEQYDGALMLDFDIKDLPLVKSYFGDNDE